MFMIMLMIKVILIKQIKIQLKTINLKQKVIEEIIFNQGIHIP